MVSSSESSENVTAARARAGSMFMDWLDEFEPDLRIAAAHNVCVLIAAHRDLALRVARDIANRDRTRSGMRVVDCDALDPHAVRAAVTDSFLPEAQAAGGCGTLLLREVHALDPQTQSVLADLLASEKVIGGGGPRVIASTSASLFDRVQSGQFDDLLFYRLNTIYMAFMEV
jgi:Sigma-54 interaction domain